MDAISTYQQAIRTRYVGPGNVRGSRIIATAGNHRRSFGVDNSIDLEDNHRSAAIAIARELNWLRDFEVLVGGTFAGDRYWVFAQRADIIDR